jgi:hypothetical protein
MIAGTWPSLIRLSAKMLAAVSAARFWRSRPVLVPEGSDFLGSFVVEALRAGGAGHVLVPRSLDY